MADDAGVNQAADTEPIFRAFKRRKIQRKRANNEEDEARSESEDRQDGGTTTPHDQLDDTGRVMRVERRPGARKGGIAFTSGVMKSTNTDESQEMAMVPADTTQLQEQIQNDRFIKPTGRAGVIQDKHMDEYIDSKLAELRSASVAKSPIPNEADIVSIPPDYRALSSSTTKPTSRPLLNDIEEVDIANLRKRPSHPPPPNSSTPNITPTHRSSTRPPRRRRNPPARTEQDLTRDALVDEILREAQVPHYSQPLTSHPSASTSTTENDEAVAEAFKAEFLEELEARRRRKTTGGAGTAGGQGGEGEKSSNGPKLGGSRSQRVRMKALEAEAAAGKK